MSNFTRQIKQIVEKVDENCKYINNRRRAATLSLSDTKAIVSIANVEVLFGRFSEHAVGVPKATV